MLDDVRILDLTDHRGEVGPHLLADLGADVIRVDLPGRGPDGDPVRYDAYASGRTRVAAPTAPDALRAVVERLLARCDVVMDSGHPGGLDGLGLDRSAVAALNPRAVHVVVSAFGTTGPRADQPASELTVAALGGPVLLQGSRDRPPVHFSLPQVWRHAGAEAAGAALIALRRRQATGRGQFVDLSAQAAMTWTLLNAMEAHAVQGREFRRNGSTLDLALPIQLRLEAADGWVIGVPTGRLAGPLLPWLLEEGLVDPSWADIDWATFDHRHLSGQPTAATMAEVDGAIRELCRRHDRDTLFRRGLTLGATLAPLNDLSDLLAFDHLQARGFWASDGTVRWPGAPWLLDDERPEVSRGPASDPVDPAEVWADGGKVRSDDPPAATGADPAARPSGDGAPTPDDDLPPAGSLPLAGLTVLDLSWIGVGPITARALADHGATVVRVESELRLDGLRLQPPFADDQPGIDRSNFHGTFNTSKYGLALDLKQPAGRDLALRLAGWADVVIESFTPGAVDRLGLGHRQLREVNPAIITVSTSLLGPGSEVSSMAGYGYHAAAVAGFQGLVGWPDRAPDGPWVAYTDTIGPRYLIPAVLAALHRRERTGEGCHIEGAQLEMALQFLAPELAEHQLRGTTPRRLGNRSPVAAPQGVYPTAGEDRWMAISVPDDAAWAGLVEAMGRPAWATTAELASAAGRRAAHDEIDRHLARWTADRDGPTLERSLAGLGVPAGVAQCSRDLLDDPQYRHRRFYRVLDHQECGPTTYAGHQYRIDGYDGGPRWAAPCLGQHSWEVLTELLGLDDDAAARVAAEGVLI